MFNGLQVLCECFVPSQSSFLRSHRLGIQWLAIYLICTPMIFVKSMTNLFGAANAYIAVAACVVIDPTVGGSFLRAMDRIVGGILALSLAMLSAGPIWLAGYRSLEGREWLRWFFYGNGIACGLFWGYIQFLIGFDKHSLLLFSGITESLFMYALYENEWMLPIIMCFLTNSLGSIIGYLVCAYVVPAPANVVINEELKVAIDSIGNIAVFLIDAVAGDGRAAKYLRVEARLSKAMDLALNSFEEQGESNLLDSDQFKKLIDEKFRIAWELLSRQRLRVRPAAREYIYKLRGAADVREKHSQLVNCCFSIYHHLAKLYCTLQHYEGAEELLKPIWFSRSEDFILTYLSESRLTDANSFTGRFGTKNAYGHEEMAEVEYEAWSRHCDAVENRYLYFCGLRVRELTFSLCRVMKIISNMLEKSRSKYLPREIDQLTDLSDKYQNLLVLQLLIRQQFTEFVNEVTNERKDKRTATEKYLMEATGTHSGEFVMLPQSVQNFIWHRWDQCLDRVIHTINCLKCIYTATVELSVHTKQWTIINNSRLPCRQYS